MEGKVKREKFIGIRIHTDLYEFLKLFAKKSRLTVSEVVRRIIEYFYIGYLFGEFKGASLSDLKKKIEKNLNIIIKEKQPKEIIEKLK